MSDFRCNKCGGTEDAASSATGRAHAPMPNQPVQNVYWAKVRAVTCADCWVEWKGMETKVINEYRLNLLEKDHRAVLKKHMHDFLNLDGTSALAGQTPQGIPKE